MTRMHECPFTFCPRFEICIHAHEHDELPIFCRSVGTKCLNAGCTPLSEEPPRMLTPEEFLKTALGEMGGFADISKEMGRIVLERGGQNRIKTERKEFFS